MTEPADAEWANSLGKSMRLDDFRASLAKSDPPTGLAPTLAALWWAGKQDWDKAHGIVMDEGGEDSAWVHADLHRREGDLDNARYWYRQAQRPVATMPLDAEWEAIVQVLLASDTR
jgi:hypothetical protein